MTATLNKQLMENIVLIIKILQNNECANVSNEVDILCGKYNLPTTLKEGINQIKRCLKQ